MAKTLYAKRQIRLQQDIAAVMRLFTDDTGRRVRKLTAEWVSLSDGAPDELKFGIVLDERVKRSAGGRSSRKTSVRGV